MEGEGKEGNKKTQHGYIDPTYGKAVGMYVNLKRELSLPIYIFISHSCTCYKWSLISYDYNILKGNKGSRKEL